MHLRDARGSHRTTRCEVCAGRGSGVRFTTSDDEGSSARQGDGMYELSRLYDEYPVGRRAVSKSAIPSEKRSRSTAGLCGSRGKRVGCERAGLSSVVVTGMREAVLDRPAAEAAPENDGPSSRHRPREGTKHPARAQRAGGRRRPIAAVAGHVTCSACTRDRAPGEKLPAATTIY